jgi:hypothetical protein
MVKTPDTYACDLCGAETTIRTEEDLARFDGEWHSALTVDFCADCKEMPAAQRRIELDRQMTARLRAEVI